MVAISRFLLSNFIDGTVEGTDITIIDGSSNNDHTYFGNGCRIDEYTPNSGSTKSCSSRTNLTADGETLSIGTYYNFQAIAAGSGGLDYSENNSVVLDTFCPLGWQLSYGGTGGDYYNKSRSWNYFLNSYSIAADTPGSNKIRSYPISYIYTGYFHLGTGKLFEQGNFALYKSATILDRSNTYGFKISSNSVWSNGDVKAIANPVRCVNFLASLHRRHGGKRICE